MCHPILLPDIHYSNIMPSQGYGHVILFHRITNNALSRAMLYITNRTISFQNRRKLKLKISCVYGYELDFHRKILVFKFKK